MLTRALVTIRQHAWSSSLARRVARLPGVGRLARRLADRAVPRGARVWVQVKAGLGRGLWLQADPYRELGYMRGNPEPGVLEVLQRHLAPGACFLDVGAHIGFYSLIAARLVGEQGVVIAFEPDPENASLLRENVRRNQMSQIAVVPAVVWSSIRLVPFRRSAAIDSSGSSRRGGVTLEADPPNDSSTFVAGTLTLDDYAEGRPPATLIKIDVEGSEVEVLKGAERLLTDAKPHLVCEIHHQEAAQFWERYLTQKRYTLDWLPAASPFPFPRHVLARPHR